jgi:hypothetical protein
MSNFILSNVCLLDFRGMVAPRVRLTVGRGYGDLELWGRTPDGQWWALVSWEGWIAHGFERARSVQCAGWAAAEHVMPAPAVNYDRVTRIALDEDPTAWPRPPGGLYYGVLTAGQKPEPPDGMRWSQPRISTRERNARYEQAPPTDRRRG